jgi:radical SAM superfamily enzyme YgiQ (UPF0313 family)
MINLINLPQPNSLDDRLDPPLGLMYIAAVLRENGDEVKITDLSFVDRRDWKKTIGFADIYGITVFSASLCLAIEVATICKQNNPWGRVVVGGPHPTSLPSEMMEFFDCVVKGEGEYALFTENSGIKEQPQIVNLSQLPLPARDLVDIQAYTRKVAGYKATSITTSRGCPYSCAFCCKDVFGHRVRYFSILHVIDEIQSIIQNYGIRAFIFYDDTFALDRKRFYPLCESLKQLDIVYRCNGDVRNNTLDDFKVLYDSGCREMAFGIESGSQEILDMMGKGATVEKNKQAIINAKKAGLITKAFLMVGNPGESVKTIEATKKFMEEADPDQYTLFQFVPLPGCDIWKNPNKYGVRIFNSDFRDYYNIAGHNEGGITMETDSLSSSKIRELKADLLSFLQNRNQRGKLQDYYATNV